MNRNSEKPRSLRVALATGAIAALCAPSLVQAQDQTNALEEVVITGTRIRTAAEQGALPVQTINSQEIQASGAQNVENLLQTVSVNLEGNTNNVQATGSGATSGGVSSVSLRGLGSQRTLVLINGRRVAGGGNITDSTSVDVNTIPLEAIERIDVLKDSASAIYGSDAIAGVVNFVVRNNFQGMQLSANGGGTSGGGGAVKRISGIAGIGDLAQDRFNVMFAADYEQDDALFGSQRSFANSSVNVGAANDTTSGNTFPANVVPLDGSFPTSNPLAGNCAPSVIDPLNHPDTRCRFDTASYVSLLPQVDRYNLYSTARFALTPDIQLYGEASYSQRRSRYVIQPVPLSDQFAIPSNNPLASNPFYQNGSCGPYCSTVNLLPSSAYYPTAFVVSKTGGPTPGLDVFYRSLITGNRDLTDSSGQPRVVLGVKGTAAGWDFNGDFLYTQTQLTEYDNGGYPLYTRILPLLNSGAVNFFGPSPASVVDEALATNYIGPAYKTKTTLAELEGTATKAIYTLPSGPLNMAVDAAFRKEKFETDPSAVLQQGDLSGYGGNFLPQRAQRNVVGAALEFQVPILASLSANPAVRYDHYEGVGGKTTPKISLLWKPLNMLQFRGSYSKGFRAPSLTELYQPQTQGVSAQGITDPSRCTITGSTTDCETQFNIQIGGNTHLRPETSDNYTFGFLVQPIPDLSVNVDGFAIKLQNTIIFGINPQDILNNPALYGYLVSRGAPTANCPGCPGPIASINQLNANFGETDVKGFDLDLRYRSPATPIGQFTFSLVGTYFATYRIEQPDGSFLNVAGKVSPITNGNGGVIPRWHQYAMVNWSSGPWGATLAHNYQSSYQDLPSTISGTTPNVSAYSTVDIQGTYSGVPHLQLAIGARNVLNRNPPYTNAGGQNYFQSGYDPGYADPRGRFIYGTVTYAFAPKR